MLHHLKNVGKFIVSHRKVENANADERIVIVIEVIPRVKFIIISDLCFFLYVDVSGFENKSVERNPKFRGSICIPRICPSRII